MSLQNYWNRIYRAATLAAFGLALTGVVFAFFPKVSRFRSYQQTKAGLEENIRVNEEAIKELRHKQERFGTDKYFVQQMAHEIGYAHDNETIYQFSEKSSSNSAMEAENE